MDPSSFFLLTNIHRQEESRLYSQEYPPRLTSTRNMTEHKRTTSGVIQLSLVTSDNHLTLKIVRVKGIRLCSSRILVKMTLIPDHKPLECHTRTIPYRNHSGLFNERFTFEINDDDRDKRLCFSVYDYSSEKSKMNFQGCLSFGIQNTIKKQKINGWFYLLPEDIGEFRHKQVSQQDEKQVTEINRDIADLKEYQFIIPRGSDDSFGFTVVGDSPTFVGKVHENSPAAQCGLKSGDFLVKVNGRNVSRAQQRTVSYMIKHLKHSVTLDIHRYHANLVSLASSTETISTEESSTFSDSSLSYRERNPLPPSSLPNQQFIELAQLGHYIEPRSFVRQNTTNAVTPFYQMTNTSVLAMKGSPTNTFV